MKMTRYFLFALCLSVSVLAQNSDVKSPAKRDAQAIAAIQAALAALGEDSQNPRMHDCIATGHSDDGGSFNWKNSGNEFRYEHTDADGRKTISISGHGKPVLLVNGTQRPLPRHTSDFEFAPHLLALKLLSRLQGNDYELNYEGSTVVNGTAAFQIALVSKKDKISEKVSPQTWYLDTSTGLPVRVDFQAPDLENVVKPVTVEADLSDYRQVQGYRVPFNIHLKWGSNSSEVYTLDSVSINTGISPSEFDAPAGGAQ
jgi:outer membrane lipoprotein-sorting protein